MKKRVIMAAEILKGQEQWHSIPLQETDVLGIGELAGGAPAPPTFVLEMEKMDIVAKGRIVGILTLLTVIIM